ncbi:hypothetical protein LCGC14_2803420, partial [marine sediment metagenome]
FGGDVFTAKNGSGITDGKNKVRREDKINMLRKSKFRFKFSQGFTMTDRNKIQTKKGGFFEFDKYCFECSNCRRKFDYAEHITTISKNSVEQVIKEALKNKLKVKEFRKKLTEFGIYIYL